MAGFLKLLQKLGLTNKTTQFSSTVQNLLQNQKSLQYPADLFDAERGEEPPFILFSIRDGVAQGADVKQFITLYLPPEIKVGYGAEYNTIDLSFLRSVKTINDLKNLLNSDNNNLTFRQKALGTLITLTGNDSSIGQQLQRAASRTVNPHEAVIFKNVDFRSFGFTFQLMARNPQEAVSIREIIKTFKMAMHPGEGDSGETRFWKFPDNFDIQLFSGGGYNNRLFRVDTSALVNMEIDYGGSGVPSFFGDHNIQDAAFTPVDIRMTLTFRELSVLTKEKIAQDY